MPVTSAAFWQTLGRRNPAYLVSAALMILGVYTIIQPGRQDLGNLPAILATFSTFQVYELLLVGIALYLVCRRRVMDDGATVVLIESLFVVGCFVIADEAAFGDGRVVLGLVLGLCAAALAAARFGVLGLVVGRKLPLSVLGLVLLALFAWNGIAPSCVALLHDLDSPFIDAGCLAGWWVLSTLALGLALCAGLETGALWPRGQAFVESRFARWAIAGLVVLATALHQYWLAYILDVPVQLSDVIPLVTVVCLGAVGLLASDGVRVTVREHLVAALPAALCVLAVLTGGFEQTVLPAGTAVSVRSAYAHDLRALCWPPAWLGIAAVLALIHAWRRRSLAFAHQGAVVALAAALFWTSRSPGRIEVSVGAFGAVLAAYVLVAAIVKRSPGWVAAFLAVANLAAGWAWPAKPVLGVYVQPAFGLTASAGASCLALWLAFRRRDLEWVAHTGAGLMLLGTACATFAPATQAPGWVLAVVALWLGGAIGLVGRLFGWWPYYGLAAAAVVLAPARLVSRSGAALGSPKGWLLVIAAFLALGLGLLVSTKKGGTPKVPG